MPNWNKIVVSGSDARLASLFVNGSATILGTLNATSSYARNSKTASYVSGTFSRAVTLADVTSGVSTTGSYAVWRSPYPCRVLSLYGRKSGTGTPQIMFRKSGSGGYSYHTGSTLKISSEHKWFRSNTVTNTDYTAGDSLEIIISGSGAKSITAQIDFRKL